MKLRLLAAVATLAAGASLALGTAPTASAASGLHHLMVYKPSSVHSVLINTVDAFGDPFSACRRVSEGTGWVDGRQDLYNGASLNVITFTSVDCGAGYSVSRWFTVPGDDGLGNFYVNMT